MNKGVEILLARMERQPEELGRWEHLFNTYKKYLVEEDKKAFWDKICEIKQQEFTDNVIKTLFDDKQREERKTLKSIQEIAQEGLDLVWKEAYAKHTLDAFKYLTKDKL